MAVGGLVRALAQLPGDHHPGGLGERFGDVPGKVPPRRAAQEQRLPVPPLAGPGVVAARREAATVNAATATSVAV